MSDWVDDSEEFAEGVDRKQLTTIKRTFLALNEQKYVRTLAGLSERQQQFVKLLPLLFHVNHPMLPGYVSHQNAAGVHGYTPSEEDLHTAKTVARSFSYPRDFFDRQSVVDALFLMGSLGSIAHSESSDIDVWVCYNSQLDASACAELEEKCRHLTRWAAQVIHIEVNFFLMDAEKFSRGHAANLDGDASGSAQHFLLLDEFYRTAIWLAGKIPLWWFVPAEQEQKYKNYALNLLDKRFIRSSDVIDFGGVPLIPDNEFMGAGVWQLYKAIDAPYKSVLKLLLLESYTHKKFSEPLSLSLKRKIHSTANINADSLDAYGLIYDRLENYLTHQQQLSRLELVRRCFYFKTAKKLSKSSHTKSWQRSLLEKMVKEWGWQPQHLVLLDRRSEWKAAQVLVERNLLANELDQAYRLLLDMQKNIPGNSAIASNELLLLGRKLHAAFERKAGKIDWINPDISQDLGEPSLCFVQHQERDHEQSQEQDAWVWKVYQSSQQELTSYGQVEKPIKRSHHFMEAFLWCYYNGVLTSTTRVDIVSKKVTLQSSQIQQLHHHLKQWTPLPLVKPVHEVFTDNVRAQRVLLLLNVGIEPQADLRKKGMILLSNQLDAFGYSGLKENLVMSVDMVHSNSWGEMVCRHFDTDALVNCLLHYLRMLPPYKDIPLPDLNVHCLSLGQNTVIEQRVKNLWHTVATHFYSKSAQPNARFIFEMATEYFLLQFIQQQPHIFRFKTYEKLLEKLSAPQAGPSAITLDEFALADKALRLMCETVKVSGIHVFYKIDGHLAYISILDYRGSLFNKTMPLTSSHQSVIEQSVLRPLYRFLGAVLDRQLRAQEISADVASELTSLESLHLYEIVSDAKLKHARVETRLIQRDITQPPFINICVIAEPVANLQLRFTLFCDGKEFSELEFGPRIYVEVAEYILSFRHLDEFYPCHITDLDLSLCRDYLSPHTGIQLIHYLQIKEDIEHKLTSALQSLRGKH